jgi:hypothetical protein
MSREALAEYREGVKVPEGIRKATRYATVKREAARA